MTLQSPFGEFYPTAAQSVEDAGGIQSPYGSEIATTMIIQQLFHRLAQMSGGDSEVVLIALGRMTARSIAHIAVNLKANGTEGDLEDICLKLLDMIEDMLPTAIDELADAKTVSVPITKVQ
jgi:hypothetical protein